MLHRYFPEYLFESPLTRVTAVPRTRSPSDLFSSSRYNHALNHNIYRDILTRLQHDRENLDFTTVLIVAFFFFFLFSSRADGVHNYFLSSFFAKNKCLSCVETSSRTHLTNYKWTARADTTAISWRIMWRTVTRACIRVHVIASCVQRSRSNATPAAKSVENACGHVSDFGSSAANEFRACR